MKVAILIIAAGASRRLGQPKQLVAYRNSFLLDYIIDECNASDIGDVFLVLGANKGLIEPQIDHSKIKTIFYNENWQNGMGASIACGISNIENLNYDAAIIVMSDQPYFNQQLLKDIVNQQQNTKSAIVISKYQEGKGPPTLFLKTLFSALKQLNSDTGAKSIIQKHKNKIAFIHFENGHIDIDTPEDLKHLL
jgi:molybdenum cofactor cytidylyltransferase